MEHPRYLKGKIYLIKNINDDRVYIGSTTESLSSRLSKHKHDCRYYNTRTSLYKYINDNNWNDWNMSLYQEYPCLNKKELEKKEYEVMGSFQNVLNKKKRAICG
jgi:hypothetical protein